MPAALIILGADDLSEGARTLDDVERGGREAVGRGDGGRGRGVEGARVLVVDDTAQIRLLIRLNLELEGHVVEEAEDGQAALDRLRDTSQPRPDVVTIDAVMDRRDGWTTLADIRRDPQLADLPVVMVTASVQAHQRARARAVGVDALVAKPFEPTTLVEVVERLATEGRGALAF